MKSSGERKFHKFNAKFKPAFCQYTVVCSAIFHFSAVFSDIFKQICQNFSIFIFKKKFGCFLNNFVRFFSMINNKFFQFEDFQLQIFQAFIFSILFWEKYFSGYFFQNNFCQISAPNFSDFWRINIQNFQSNFFGDCTQRFAAWRCGGLSAPSHYKYKQNFE